VVDFDVVGLWRGTITENGAGALNLHVQSQNDWLVSAAPAGIVPFRGTPPLDRTLAEVSEISSAHPGR
jgi:hypothetical protein